MAGTNPIKAPRPGGILRIRVMGSEQVKQVFRNMGRSSRASRVKMIKGMAKAIYVVQAESSKQLSFGPNRAILSGFMRASLNPIIDISRSESGRIKAFLVTSAFYDVLVHEGWGVHANPPYSVEAPAEFKPSPGSEATIPAGIRAMQQRLLRIRHKSRHKFRKGPRPFMRVAFNNSKEKMIIILSSTIRNIIQGAIDRAGKRMEKS
jgi:hypothetical protein